KLLSLPLLLTLFLSLAASNTYADELNAPSVKDTYIQPGVTGSQGQETTLKLEKTADFTSYVFLQFDLNSLPSNASISKAEIKMYNEQAGPQGCYVQVQ